METYIGTHTVLLGNHLPLSGKSDYLHILLFTISLLGTYHGKSFKHAHTHTHIHMKTCTWMFIAGIYIITKNQTKSQCLAIREK